MDFFAERLFYCLVAADVLLLVFLCGACVVTWRRRESPPENAEAAVVVEACPPTLS